MTGHTSDPSFELLARARRAFRDDDAAAVREILATHEALRARIDEPLGDFDAPAITAVRSREMLDVLLEAGADINARSRWWAGGFGLLDHADAELAAYAVARGAVLTVHAAARLGMRDELGALLAENPALVRARGGDGQTPLHFAATVEIAQDLLARGAEIDARDVDHESTPAQYMVRSRQEVARYLVGRGSTTDVLMAAALGDIELVREHLRRDPACIRMRVSDEYFPMVGSRAGGTIYQWELGWYVSACQVARAFDHREILDLLMEQSPSDERLLNLCWLHDEGGVRTLLGETPGLAATLSEPGRRQLAHAARNDDTVAARLMLLAGLPVDTFSQHHATPLHWAAWHGNAELVRLILRHDPPLENSENDFGGTPLGWALHGSEHGWHCERGDYVATVEALLEAGATPPAEAGGTEAVRDVLRRRGVS